jgi:hypothetical protein
MTASGLSPAASDPSRIGSDQVRGVRFEGERMVLIPPPRQTGQGEEHREITWERIAAEWSYGFVTLLDTAVVNRCRRRNHGT